VKHTVRIFLFIRSSSDAMLSIFLIRFRTVAFVLKLQFFCGLSIFLSNQKYYPLNVLLKSGSLHGQRFSLQKQINIIRKSAYRFMCFQESSNIYLVLILQKAFYALTHWQLFLRMPSCFYRLFYSKGLMVLIVRRNPKR
jgi:hypothetical protein